MNWPPNTRIMALRHDDRALEVSGSTELHPGDQLTFLVPTEHAAALGDLDTAHLPA